MKQDSNITHRQQTLAQRNATNETSQPRIDAVYMLNGNPNHVPIALEAVHAGFPSVAQDYFSGDFSFDEHVITHPNSTFIVRVAGDSMVGAGIFDGDLVVVDRSLLPTDGDVVIAVLNSELTLKRLRCKGKEIYLQAENPRYPDFHLCDGEELVIWGVVTGNYHWQHPGNSSQVQSEPAPHVTYPQPGHESTYSRTKQVKDTVSQSAHTGNHSAHRNQSHYPSSGWNHHV